MEILSEFPVYRFWTQGHHQLLSEFPGCLPGKFRFSNHSTFLFSFPLMSPLSIDLEIEMEIERERYLLLFLFVWITLTNTQFSRSVMSDSLQPHGLQHTRLPCLSPTPGACSDSCPLSQWCHLTISSFVLPFPSCLQSFPAPGSFPMSQFFTSGGQRIRVIASASVLPLTDFL